MGSGIYIITNLVNGKNYIGESINWRKRLEEHRTALVSNRHNNNHLQRSFNENGIINFQFELLEECEEEFLKSQENYWCNILQTHHRDHGYNIEPTGPYGKTRLAEETKKKISDLRKEQYKDPTKNPFYGRSHSQETRLIMSLKGVGKKKKPWSEERRNKTLATRSETYKTKRECQR